jgi:hypothetical protein
MRHKTLFCIPRQLCLTSFAFVACRPPDSAVDEVLITFDVAVATAAGEVAVAVWPQSTSCAALSLLSVGTLSQFGDSADFPALCYLSADFMTLHIKSTTTPPQLPIAGSSISLLPGVLTRSESSSPRLPLPLPLPLPLQISCLVRVALPVFSGVT